MDALGLDVKNPGSVVLGAVLDNGVPDTARDPPYPLCTICDKANSRGKVAKFQKD